MAAIGENWQQQILYNINGNTYTKFQLFPWHVRYTSGDLGEGHDLSSVAFSSSPTRLTQRRVRFDRYKRNASLSPPSNELANVTISLLVPRSRPHEVKQRAMSSNRHAVPTPRKFFSSQTQIFRDISIYHPKISPRPEQAGGEYSPPNHSLAGEIFWYQSEFYRFRWIFC